MHQLMYVSAATHEVNSQVLEQILEVSRRNNPQDDVTGLLLYIDGGFLQILEGPRDSIYRVYQRIARDPRHDSHCILLDRETDCRLFPGWTMGFDRITSDQKETAGVFAITRKAIEEAVSEAQAAEIAIFLRTFYRVNTHRHAA